MREDRLFFFQFPDPFPTFISKATAVPSSDDMPVDTTTSETALKKVSFAPDVKPGISESSKASAVPADSSKEPNGHESKIDGIIGNLEIYRSGAVKMRLANGILLDVRFLRHQSTARH